MTKPVAAVPGTGMLVGPDWELRADRVDDLGEGRWSATVARTATRIVRR